MILSVLRSTLCADELQIPARPVILSAQVENYEKSANGSISVAYKVVLGNVKRRATTTSASSSAGRWNSNEVMLLEVFGCVQKLNRAEISRWKQIAAVDLRRKKSGKMMQEPKNFVKIAGFNPGYRYQVVVRCVDGKGKRSLYSQPIFIVPPPPSTGENRTDGLLSVKNLALEITGTKL